MSCLSIRRITGADFVARRSRSALSSYWSISPSRLCFRLVFSLCMAEDKGNSLKVSAEAVRQWMTVSAMDWARMCNTITLYPSLSHLCPLLCSPALFYRTHNGTCPVRVYHTISVHISLLLIPLPEESSQQQDIRNRHLRRPLLPSKATTHKPNGVFYRHHHVRH